LIFISASEKCYKEVYRNKRYTVKPQAVNVGVNTSVLVRRN
jgi:hypothetical protein